MATSGMPPMPVDDSAGPQTAMGSAPAPASTGKHFGVLGRLLGQKYQDEMWRMHEQAKFLQNEIHAAWNDPSNRMPDEILDSRISDLSKLLGGTPEHAKEIKQKLQDHTEKLKASKALAQFHNDTAKPGQAPPAVPAAAPASPQQDDSAGPRVGGLPPIPFGSGAPSSAPIPNEPAPVKAAADLSGTGDGIPPPMPVAPVAPPTAMVAQAAPASRNRISRAQLGQEQGEQELAAKQPAALLAMRMQQMLIDQGRNMGLSGTALADWVNKHPVSHLTDLAPGNVAVGADGKIMATGAPRITALAPGAQAMITPTAGGPQGAPGLPPAPGLPTPPQAPGQPPLPNGATMIQGPPALLSPAQRAANQMWEGAHGTAPKPEELGQALSAYNEAAITPSARKLQEGRLANFAEMRKMRLLEEQKLGQTIKEFEATKGAGAIDSLADQVHANPDLFQKLTGDTANLVAQRFQAKYNLPAPRPLPADMKNKEDGSLISLNHIDAIRELLKNPVIQQRLGSFTGRVGELEQKFGSTLGLSAVDARVIQDFRSRIPYLFGQEAKALYGGRPAAKLLDGLKASSPSMSKGLPLFLGALDAAEAMGKLNIKSADDYRFNKRGVLTPPPGAPKSAEDYLKSIGH